MLITLEDEFGPRVRSTLDSLVREGAVAYGYDVRELVCGFAERWIAAVLFDDVLHPVVREDLLALADLTDEKRSYLETKLTHFSTDETMSCPKSLRVYSLTEHAERLPIAFPDAFSAAGVASFVKEPLNFSRDRVWDTIPAGWTGLDEQEQRRLHELAEQLQRELQEDKKRHGPAAIVARRRKGEILPFYYAPQSGFVVSLWAANACRLYELADELADLAQRIDPRELDDFLFGA